MRKLIIAGFIMVGSLFAMAPGGVAVVEDADAATCTPKYGSCNPYIRPNTSCCSKYCKATSPTTGVCV